MTTRRKIFMAAGAVATALPLAAWSQQPATRVARVGWLSFLAPPDPGLALLREGMRELGYAEGRHYVIVPRFADNDFSRLPGIVEELAGERIDVLVARGPTINFTKPIRLRVPVVFAFSGDPVEAGFGNSLRAPGRNMTGVTMLSMELSAKRVEVLREAVPNAKRIALLSNPEHAGELSEYRVTDHTARRHGATVNRHLVHNPRELAAAFTRIAAEHPDAMLVFPDSLTMARRSEITEFAARARVPSMYGWTEFAESGGLLSYGSSLTESFKSLAIFVTKILEGANASDIPIEQVRTIALAVNLGAAKALGLTLPQSILVRADKVIE